MGAWYSSIEYMYKYTINAKVNVDFCVDIERKPRALHWEDQKPVLSGKAQRND